MQDLTSAETLLIIVLMVCGTLIWGMVTQSKK